jgi:predicted transcriptional regulator
VREVKKGLSQVDSGRTLSHEEVGLRLKKHLTDKPPVR